MQARVSDDFLTAEEFKEGNACLVEFELSFSETVKSLIGGQGASYDFSVAARNETLGQIGRLKRYVSDLYGINIEDISLEVPDGELLENDLEKYVCYKKLLEKLAMTLAQLEENAVKRFSKDSTDRESIIGSFKAMVQSNYGVKLGAEGYVGSSLDKLKQLLHDVQVWEFNCRTLSWVFEGEVLSRGPVLYPALSYHVSLSRDTQAERDHTIAQVSRITQSVADQYGWRAQRGESSGFNQLPDKFNTFGVSEALCDGRKGMKKTIEEIAFSLHILEERKVAGFKGMYPNASEADIDKFRKKICREIGENHSGDRFWCPGGTYPKLQLILNDIRSSESFESLLIFAKRQFAENLVSERLNAIDRSGQSTHIVPYVINTIARGWGLKEKDRREDESVLFYDDLPNDFISEFQTELTKRFSSGSFIKLITESLPSKIMEKTVVVLPNFSKYEDSDGWITIVGEDGKETEAYKKIRRSQDDYIADIISVFSRFGINGYFGETDETQKKNVRTLLFKNTTVSSEVPGREDVVSTVMKVEVSYANLLRFVKFACMYKMASYDPPLISGVSKEVFKVPLESYKESIKARGVGLPRRYIDPSAVLSGFGFEGGSGDMEYAQCELVCFALDNDIKIYDANSHRAPITPVDYLLELATASPGDAASPGLLGRYLDNQFGNGGLPPLSLLMRFFALEDPRELLRLCCVFRDKEDDELDKILQAVLVLHRMQAPGYVLQERDFYSLLPLIPYDYSAGIKACLSPSMGARFTEYLIREAIVLVKRNGLALRGLDSDLKNNKEVVLAAVGQYGYALEFASAALKRDRNFVLAAVRQNGFALRYASAELQGDREVVLAAVEQNGFAFRHASAALKRDRGFVLEAVGQNGYALKCADASLKRDRGVVLAAVGQNVHALEYASDELRGDRDFMLPLVRQNGFALEYASDELRGDRGVVLAAIGQNYRALEYASDELRGDRGVVLAAVGQNGYALECAGASLRGNEGFMLPLLVRQNYRALEYASDALKGDKGFMLPLVRQNYRALEYASDALKGDKDVMLAVVRQDGYYLEYASDALKRDKEVVLAAVGQNVHALEYASDALKGDKVFMLPLVRQNYRAFLYASDALEGDKDVMLAVVRQDGYYLEYASDALKRDKEVVLAAVGQNAHALKYAGASLRGNEVFMLPLVRQNYRALEYASDALKGDKGFMLPLVRQNYRALWYADASLKGDKDVMLAVVRRAGYYLKEASAALKRDKEVVLAAVGQKVWALQYADDSLKGDKDVMLAVVRQAGYYLEYASAALKRDKDVVLAAVRQNVWALQHADDSLKGDKDVVLAAVGQDVWALRHASDELRGDRDFMLPLVRQNGFALEYASDELRGDRGVVLAAVGQDAWALRYADDSLKGDKDVVLVVVRQNGRCLEYASDALKRDRQVVLAAVRQNGFGLRYASDDLKVDKEVVFVALANDPSCIEYVQPVLRRSMDATALLAHLKAEIISTLPERYRVGARELLETKAHISSEIPFVLQDEGLSDVFEMKWVRETGPEHIAAYRENLSKLLSMNVILRLCSGDIHSEKFAELCTKENIDSLSMSIKRGLADLDIKALRGVYCGIDETVGISAVIHPVFSLGSIYNWFMGMVVGECVEPQAAAPPSAPHSAPPLTQFVHDRLATVAHGEHGGVVIPDIEFSEGFFRSYIQEHAPQGVQHGPRV